jgi:hypothetical protein
MILNVTLHYAGMLFCVEPVWPKKIRITGRGGGRERDSERIKRKRKKAGT